MNPRDLGGAVLRSVSRSFYLSIRILPARIREPIGLAYLLARASDTIADSADAPPAIRRQHLAAFASMVRAGDPKGLAELQRAISSSHAGERELIARLGDCLAWLGTVGEFDRDQIRSVLAKIIHGQDLDLARFGEPGGITALQTGAELEEYAYLVAGCVGEFWTDVCLHHLPRYSRLDPVPLRSLGIDFGKGLQLVNILRDLPADLRTGRCYLPEDEIDPQRVVADPAAAREVFTRWRERAEALLDSGRQYIESLRPARLRAACFLPWDLGRETLHLMAQHPPLETPHRLKVPRSAVRRSLWRAVGVALWRRPLG